ncbi:MAG: PadR family transcriptional regulator [Gemmatimonadota bacterium]
MDEGMSRFEYHVLLALAEGPLHGYAVTSAVETESDGAVRPRAGSLYRVLARLMGWGWVEEAEPVHPDEPHPGRTRRYYALTAHGRAALAAESRRLRRAAALAERRLRAAEGSS